MWQKILSNENLKYENATTWAISERLKSTRNKTTIYRRKLARNWYYIIQEKSRLFAENFLYAADEQASHWLRSGLFSYWKTHESNALEYDLLMLWANVEAYVKECDVCIA